MPKRSRIYYVGQWFSTLFRAIGALFYLPNVKNAFRSVTKNWKEYSCFYLAALVMCAGFWTVALSADSNLHEARERVEEAYDYHMEVAVLDNEQYANLDALLQYEQTRENEYIDSFSWVNEGKPLADGTYSVHILLTDTYGLEVSRAAVEAEVLGKISTGRREVRMSPLYTFDSDFRVPYTVQFWAMTLAWLCLSVLMMVVLFLIRLDHFRFIYGVYMTCGADFPKLVGAAGGELMAITAITWIPGSLAGIGVTLAMLTSRGVGLYVSPLGIGTVLVGSLLAVIMAVWVPMRRMSRRPPVRHLVTGDNGGLVSSPRRSFFMVGAGFPGRYEMYGFWRMRKYYLRLVLSAVLFASLFVSGLYIAEMETFHNELDPREYVVAYRPESYYVFQNAILGDETGDDESDESAPVWTVLPEEAAMVREDADLFLSELEAIPGVSHAEWAVTMTGGYAQDHLLLTSEQLWHANQYVVGSEERAADGYRWATNNYTYTAVDKTWIDNITRNGLGTFDGDPYAVLEKENHLILTEDIFNEETFRFKPGDTVVVAVCTKGGMLPIVTDPLQHLRDQIKLYTFRYETYTVAAVLRDTRSEVNVTLGVTYEDYAALTETVPLRDELTVYMENGTDLATVREADPQIRLLLRSFKDWTVTPTGHYFDTQVRSLKNDGGVILTLAACLLLISPMVWYFSQLMFYRKRRHEFALLSAMGAPGRSIAKLHRLAGGVLSGAAFLVTVGLTLLCNYVVYFTVGTLLPKLGLTESVHYVFHLSLPALVACVVVSVLCGFLSCELPYRLYARRSPEDDKL